MNRFNKRVITGEKGVDVIVDKGSIWIVISDKFGDRIAETSCSKETATAIATMILNAVQKS